jgi:GNAT superfamily N-acetyltransferase
MVDFRPLDPERDLGALAALLNLTANLPVTPELLAEWRRRAHPDRLRQQWVAVDDADGLIGVGDCVRDPWMPPGQFWVDILVAPAFRQQGIGAQLFEVSAAWAREQGALYLGGDVRDDQPEGLRFARTYGFQEVQHTAEHQLDLAGFDFAVFAPLIARLQADGFNFLSYEEAGDTRDHRKAIYRLHKRVIVDDPTFTGVHLPFDEYRKRIFESTWARADELFVALRGAAWLGFTQLADFPDSSTVVMTYTGVEDAYRRRGVATALKALALAHAKARGVNTARLTADSRDVATQALAARFGYAAEPGSRRMVRSIQDFGHI